MLTEGVMTVKLCALQPAIYLRSASLRRGPLARFVCVDWGLWPPARSWCWV